VRDAALRVGIGRDTTIASGGHEIHGELAVAVVFVDALGEGGGLNANLFATNGVDHALCRAVDVDVAGGPRPAVEALGVDDHVYAGAVTDYAAAGLEIDLDVGGVLWHDVSSAQARADGDIGTIGGGVCDEDEGVGHTSTESKGIPAVGVGGDEAEVEVIVGVIGRDVDSDGEIGLVASLEDEG